MDKITEIESMLIETIQKHKRRFTQAFALDELTCNLDKKYFKPLRMSISIKTARPSMESRLVNFLKNFKKLKLSQKAEKKSFWKLSAIRQIGY
jgi:hypothetical protein